MKSALSLTLIVCLVGSALPAAAQDRLDEPTSGPIARAVTREAVRLATAQPNEPADRDWSRVRDLKSGTEIIVTVGTSRPARRSFVRADDSSLWIRAIDLDLDLMPIARADVTEIRQVNKPRHPVREGVLIGLGAGAGVGLAIASTRQCRGAECSFWAWYSVALSTGLGIGIGAIIGAVVGAVRDDNDPVIYRTPDTTPAANNQPEDTASAPRAPTTLAPPIGAAVTQAKLASAAHSFIDLQPLVKTGDMIHVTDSSGAQIKGRITQLSAASLAVTVQGARREFAVDAVSLIERRWHPILKGALIGLGIGAGVGILAGRTQSNSELLLGAQEAGVKFLTGITVGAAAGTAAGALITQRRVLYSRAGLLESTNKDVR